MENTKKPLIYKVIATRDLADLQRQVSDLIDTPIEFSTGPATSYKSHWILNGPLVVTAVVIRGETYHDFFQVLVVA